MRLADGKGVAFIVELVELGCGHGMAAKAATTGIAERRVRGAGERVEGRHPR